MIIKASGRSALILLTGLLVGFAQPSQAGPDAKTAAASSKSETATGAPIKLNKFTKRGARHVKKNTQRKSRKAALKSSSSQKATEVAEENRNDSIAIPPSVANANAQLPSPEVRADSARAMSAKANTMLPIAANKPADAQPAAETAVVAADQLNEIDRGLQEAPSAAPTLALASAEAPAAAAPVLASSKDDSAWDQTSLIGKIFIAFGALLTVASAARMFMA